jgi:hypothetical protein
MAKLRIFQIAKTLNISHTDILSFLKSKKVDISSHMSPVDESIHNMIMDEFSYDKEQVDRFRKEQVRKEIHDSRIKEQQSTTKKLELLSLSEQRELEKKESEKRELDLEAEKKRIDEELRKKDADIEKRKIDTNERIRVQEVKEKEHKSASSKKAKELKNKFKSNKKLRSINLRDIQSEIGAGTSKKPSANSGKKNEQVHKSVKTKVKGILAKMDTKTKKKVHRRDKTQDEEIVLDPSERENIKVAEFSNVEELGKYSKSHLVT